MYNRINKTEAFDVRYITDDIYYCFIDPFYNDVASAKSLDDKNYYDLLFPDVAQPETIGRKISGRFYDSTYNPIDASELIEKCQLHNGIIVKPAVDSEGGHGISLLDDSDSVDTYKHVLDACDNLIVQKLVRQHTTLSLVHEKSINTIRIITFAHSDTVHSLSTILRFGIGESKVDNASSGGWFCGIDEKGNLKQYAYDVAGHSYETSPDGFRFFGHHIEGVDLCQVTAKRLAGRISRTCKLASWDFAVSEQGSPIFIEVNMSYGQLDFHQMTNGPLFKDMTQEVMSEVFSSKMKKLIQKFI